MTPPFVRALHRFIFQHAMIAAGEKVIVGVSGGADSLALLYGLHSLQTELDFSLHVAHLNHCLRPDACTDAEFVRQHVARLGLPFTLRTVDVGGMLKRLKLSVETAGRAARYEFYESLSVQIGAPKIALGHHQDDTAETVLMNLIRGAATTGLKGIAPIREGLNPLSKNRQSQNKSRGAIPLVIRPLAGFTRENIETFLDAIGIKPLHDSTNTDTRFLRNRIRHELIPLLEDTYNPNIKRGLVHTATVLSAESDYLHGLASEAFKACQLQTNKSHALTAGYQKRIVLEREKFCQYHIALQRRILRHAVAEFQGQLTNFYFQHHQAILDMVNGDKPNTVLTLPAGLQFRRAYEQLIFETEASTAQKDFIHPVAASGETFIPALNATLIAELVRTSLDDVIQIPDGTFEAIFDWDTIQLPLIVRNRKPGDKFQPYGMNGTKKLKDFFIDAKLPLYERDCVPLLVSGAEILWVVGYTTSERNRVHDGTQNYLCLQYALEPRC